MKTLLLFDANSIIHRCFHALPPLTSPDGRPAQSLYGISSVLLKLMREDKPDYAAACFDRPEPTFRKEKYTEYKAHRPKAPDELISQIIAAHKLFETFGIKTFEKPGFEADDIIASLATKFRIEKGVRVVILTGDMDTLQLVEQDDLVVRTFKKGISETVTYDEAAIKEKYGIGPGQLIDYKAFVGDSSDNVKGVPGIGPKTAMTLIQKYGTLERVYENLDQDEKMKARLSPFREQAELSKMLVTLEKSVDVGVSDLKSLTFEPKEEEIAFYFVEMGFETLIRRMGSDEPEKPRPKKKEVPRSNQGTLL